MIKNRVAFKLILFLLISNLSFSQGLDYRKTFKGLASFYDKKFGGRTTASGAVFSNKFFTCAHKTLPFGTLVEVTNPDNGRKVIVQVNDRGPYHGDRVIDLSHQAAKQIGLVNDGVARIEAKVLKKKYGFNIFTGEILQNQPFLLRVDSPDYHKRLFLPQERENFVVRR